MRDYQRAKVYRAEEYLLDRWMELGDIQACIRYAEMVWANPTFQARFPKAYSGNVPKIIPSRGSRYAHAYHPPKERVALPEWAMNDYVLVHELSHIVCEREFATGPKTWIKHGPVWCGVMLFMLELFLGRRVAEDLCEAFVMEGVEYKRVNK